MRRTRSAASAWRYHNRWLRPAASAVCLALPAAAAVISGIRWGNQNRSATPGSICAYRPAARCMIIVAIVTHRYSPLISSARPPGDGKHLAFSDGFLPVLYRAGSYYEYMTGMVHIIMAIDVGKLQNACEINNMYTYYFLAIHRGIEYNICRDSRPKTPDGCESHAEGGFFMKKLFAVYLESLDQDLKVYTDEEEARQRLEALLAEGKPARMEKFESYQIIRFGKANGCSAKDPGFWEEIEYDNGRYRLIERYAWHMEPEEEGYYAEYILS